MILDLVMPQVDGFAVLDQCRAEGMPLRKVIVITGMPDKYLERLQGNALGGILRKPFDVQRLGRLLTQCVDDAGGLFEPGGEMPSV